MLNQPISLSAMSLGNTMVLFLALLPPFFIPKSIIICIAVEFSDAAIFGIYGYLTKNFIVLYQTLFTMKLLSNKCPMLSLATIISLFQPLLRQKISSVNFLIVAEVMIPQFMQETVKHYFHQNKGYLMVIQYV